MYIYRYICISRYAYMCICVYAYVYMHMCIHVYVCTYQVAEAKRATQHYFEKMLPCAIRVTAFAGLGCRV